MGVRCGKEIIFSVSARLGVPTSGEGPNERRPGPGDVSTSDCVTFTMRRWCQRARERITWPKNIDSVPPHVLHIHIYTRFRRVLFYCVWIDRLCESETRRNFFFTTIRVFNPSPFISVFLHCEDQSRRLIISQINNVRNEKKK